MQVIFLAIDIIEHSALLESFCDHVFLFRANMIPSVTKPLGEKNSPFGGADLTTFPRVKSFIRLLQVGFLPFIYHMALYFITKVSISNRGLVRALFRRTGQFYAPFLCISLVVRSALRAPSIEPQNAHLSHEATALIQYAQPMLLRQNTR